MFRLYKKTKAILWLILIGFLFIALSYIIQKNIVWIENLIKGYEILGAVIYILFLAISEVISPLSAVPIIPLASSIWGGFITSILNLAGWFLGAIIAFAIARKFGKPLVKRLVNMQELSKLENKLKENQKFFTLIILRIFLFPFDILSYALGIFTKISWKMFLITTLIGILPFAIMLAYLGLLPILIQAILLSLGLVFLLILGYILLKKNR